LAYLYRPDAPEETALANVRVLLHRAKALAVDGLEVERSRVRYEVATDVGEFTRLVEQGDPAAALRLYHGQFLSGLSVPDSAGYETWLALPRAALARTWRAPGLRRRARAEAGGG